VEEAVPHLRAAVERSPDDAANHLLLGRALLTVGDRDQAVEALERALALDPTLSEARLLLEEANRRR
jgi:cytochrome c-type biogenesis protein CcmH/NrfG